MGSRAVLLYTLPHGIEVLGEYAARGAEHNRHHKTGFVHSASSKRRTSESLKRAYATGRRQRQTAGRVRDTFGRFSR
jgi:hypothetical protein